MEVHLTPDQQARLSSMAASRGCQEESLVREAVDRMLNGDEWLLHEVERAEAALDRGEYLTHEQVGDRLQRMLRR